MHGRTAQEFLKRILNRNPDDCSGHRPGSPFRLKNAPLSLTFAFTEVLNLNTQSRAQPILRQNMRSFSSPETPMERSLRWPKFWPPSFEISSDPWYAVVYLTTAPLGRYCRGRLAGERLIVHGDRIVRHYRSDYPVISCTVVQINLDFLSDHSGSS